MKSFRCKLQVLIKKLPETSLENFYINRFGCPLYEMFFEDYTTKVWGVHPSEIGADWCSQRVKGLSIFALLKDVFLRPFRQADHGQKEMATWYNVDTTQTHPTNYPFYEKHLKAVLPIIALLTWSLFIGAYVVVIIINRQSMLESPSQKIAFAMFFVFGFIYYETTTFASPIAIRYWMPMSAVKLAFVWMLFSKWTIIKK